MGKNKKTLLRVVLLVLVVAYAFYFNIKDRVYWKYDDKWIIGKSEEEIIERYGEFDDYFNGSSQGGYKIENALPDFGLHDPPEYYIISFDEYDKAESILRLSSR